MFYNLLNYNFKLFKLILKNSIYYKMNFCYLVNGYVNNLVIFLNFLVNMMLFYVYGSLNVKYFV